MINSAGNVGGFLGPYFTGVIKEATGSIELAYEGLAISLLAAGLLMLTLSRGKAVQMRVERAGLAEAPPPLRARSYGGQARPWL